MQTAAKGGVKTLNTPVLGVRRELGAPLSSHLEDLPASQQRDVSLCQGSGKCRAQLHPVARDARRLFCSHRAVSPISPHPSQCLYFHF